MKDNIVGLAYAVKERGYEDLKEWDDRTTATWQEEVEVKLIFDTLQRVLCGVAVKGHRGEGWGVKDTARVLGESLGEVCQDIQLARAFILFPWLKKERSKTAAFRRLRGMKDDTS